MDAEFMRVAACGGAQTNSNSKIKSKGEVESMSKREFFQNLRVGIAFNLYSRPGDKAANSLLCPSGSERHIIPANPPDNAGTLREKGQH